MHTASCAPCESCLSACPASTTSRIFCLIAGEASEGEAAAQEYHVEEPDHSASEVEESPAQSKGRRRPKKADKALTQVHMSQRDM